VAREALAAAFDPLISPRSGAGHRSENKQHLRDRRTYADRVPLTFLRKKGLILLDQIRTVDKSRLVKKAGAVSDLALSNALSTLQEIFVE
jgi:mRNA-degrading endonuclease toxin of MazEF toxin-antitoxin module